MERLERSYPDLLNGTVRILRPGMVHLLANSGLDPDSLIMILGLSAETRTYFLPINDQTRDAVGGTHWSLLAFHSSPEGCAWSYHDSFGSSNLIHARNVKSVLSGVLRVLNPENRVALNNAKWTIDSCPQQTNGFDCGVFVIGFLEILVARLAHLKDSKRTMNWEMAGESIVPSEIVTGLLDTLRQELGAELDAAIQELEWEERRL